MANWTDSIVGDRMTVDREFNERIVDSNFNSQEWGLIMTATEFEIEHAGDPERARVVANTEKLPTIMPELKNIRSQMSAMGAGGGSSRGSSGGLFGSVKKALGLGDGTKDEELAEAEELVQAYADELQSHLEQNGKWERVRIAYQE